jgi:hypothetical protein
MKTSIKIPDELYSQAKTVSENFSSLVSEALKDYLRKMRVQKAVQSFGKWEKRDRKSTEITNELRIERTRNYVDRID